MRGCALALRARRTSDSNGKFTHYWCQGLPVSGVLFSVSTYNSKIIHASAEQRDIAYIAKYAIAEITRLPGHLAPRKQAIFSVVRQTLGE